MRNVVAAVTMILGAVLATGVLSPQPILGQKPDFAGVTVVNTSANPVPVTGTVSLNAGTVVQAQQAGAWTVGISGTPTVSLTAGSTVIVGNTASAPVPVQTAASTPFNSSVDFTLPSSSDSTFTATIATVPTGYQLVIEYASARVAQPACDCESNFSVSLETTAGGTTARHYIPLESMIQVNTLNRGQIGGTQTQLYADAGTSVVARLTRFFNGYVGSGEVAISGRLVAIP